MNDSFFSFRLFNRYFLLTRDWRLQVLKKNEHGQWRPVLRTEIMPDDAPQWIRAAKREGRLFRAAIDHAKTAEDEAERLRNSINYYACFIEERTRPLCSCGKVAKTQTAGGKYAQEKRHLPQNWGLYCNECFEVGVELEHEAMYEK